MSAFHKLEATNLLQLHTMHIVKAAAMGYFTGSYMYLRCLCFRVEVCELLDVELAIAI